MNLYRPASSVDEAIDRIVDLALYEYVAWLTPDYLTRGHVVKPKTAKDTQITRAKFDVLLRALSLLDPARDGTWETAIVELGVTRGVLARDGAEPLRGALSLGLMAPHYVTQASTDRRRHDGE